MKLYAGREQDREDLAAIWSRTGFVSPEAAAAMFREAYPHAPDDEFLSNYIQSLVIEAEGP